MITFNKETPVLLITYGKIEIIRQIYNVLRQIEPQRLYLFFDMPENEDKKYAYEQIRLIFNGMDWVCKVKIFSAKKRLGYNASVLRAVNRFFRFETEGIVLTGFRAPTSTFFAFCSCMLEKYRYDERIGHISGGDFRKQVRTAGSSDSYYFSKLIHTFSGWASWRRVWKDMDVQLKTLSAFKKLNIIDEIPQLKPFKFFRFDSKHDADNWEARYEYMNLINNRLSVVPNMRQGSAYEYTLPEIIHPLFMVNPLTDELLAQEVKYRLPAITVNKPCGINFLQEQLISYKSETSQRMRMPRIIHQIYEDPVGPPNILLKFAETWKKKMPDWEYRFWNRRMIRDFLDSVCPDFSGIYNSYPFNVQRWDAIRYLILYHIGGLYIDLDYECILPLDVLLAGSSCCMGMEPAVNSRFFNKSFIIGNALMAARPRHPYMKAIIEEMKANHSVNYHKGDSMQIMETTGPFMVTKVYERLRKKKDVTLLSADLVTPLTLQEVVMLRAGKANQEVARKIDNAFAVHYFFGTWTEQTAEGKL